jgi:hypothetical protein
MIAEGRHFLPARGTGAHRRGRAGGDGGFDKGHLIRNKDFVEMALDSAGELLKSEQD